MGSIFTKREIYGEKDVKEPVHIGMSVLPVDMVGDPDTEILENAIQETWEILRCGLEQKPHDTRIFSMV